MAGRGTDIKLGEGVAELGGLHVIGTERHESRRIDRQLAGRCARQGDPGYCQFFVSLEDEIIEAFGEKPAARLRKRYRGRGELTSTAHATARLRRPGQEGTPALPRPQAADALREAARRDAEEHGAQPRAGLTARTAGPPVSGPDRAGHCFKSRSSASRAERLRGVPAPPAGVPARL